MEYSEILARPLIYLVEPTKRLFFGYLLSAFVLGLLVMLFKGLSIRQSFAALFNKKVWQHPSAQVDYKIFVFNAILSLLFVAFTSLSSLGIANKLLYFFDEISDFSGWDVDYYTGILLYTVLSFVALDFSRFFQHYCMHKIPFLWQFHKVHHSAEVLTPLSLYRVHPIESIIGAIRQAVVLGVLAALFIFITKAPIGGYEIIGINILDFGFNMLGSNLRHSHVWLSFGPLNYLFISPAQHQIHHSRSAKHFDKNFGISLAIWDQLFGSFYNVSKRPFLVFGVRGEKHRSLTEAMLAPFNLYDRASHRVSKAFGGVQKGVSSWQNTGTEARRQSGH